MAASHHRGVDQRLAELLLVVRARGDAADGGLDGDRRQLVEVYSVVAPGEPANDRLAVRGIHAGRAGDDGREVRRRPRERE
jgi:hypothetical protein